jgi:hypothetical protein
LPQWSARPALVTDAANSIAPRPNPTAATPALPNPNRSSSQAPKETNRHCDAAIKQPIAPTINQADAGRRTRRRGSEPGDVGSVVGRTGTGGEPGTALVPPGRRRRTTAAMTTTNAAPAPYAQRHPTPAVSNPSAVTPIRSPSAQDVSVIPPTRPRLRYGTSSAIQLASPTSNAVFDMLSTASPMARNGRPAAVAATTAPIVTPARPRLMEVRRGRRSTVRPMSGEARPKSSATLSATPARASDTPIPPAIVARNGAAYR